METIEISLRPNRVALFCALFVVGAGLFYRVFGYVPTAFWVFGAVLVVAVPYRLLRGFGPNPCIVLDAEGIEDKRLKVGRIAWRDIRRPLIHSLSGAQYVCLELHNPEAYKSRMPAAQRFNGLLLRVWGMTPFAISMSCLDVDAPTLVEYIHRGCQAAHTR
jgi:hypothetical protein